MGIEDIQPTFDSESLEHEKDREKKVCRIQEIDEEMSELAKRYHLLKEEKEKLRIEYDAPCETLENDPLKRLSALAGDGGILKENGFFPYFSRDALRLYEQVIIKRHRQTLEQLESRGGMGIMEVYAAIKNDSAYCKMSVTEEVLQLLEQEGIIVRSSVS